MASGDSSGWGPAVSSLCKSPCPKDDFSCSIVLGAPPEFQGPARRKLKKWRHEDRKCPPPSSASRYYPYHADGPSRRCRLPRFDETEYSKARDFKSQYESSKTRQRRSPHPRHPADVSSSTTRSSSGVQRDSTRCGEIRVHSNSLIGAEVSTAAGWKLTKPGEECESDPVQQRAAAASSRSTTAEQTEAAAAAANPLEMTENEVRAYASQLQALTQVLLRNMRCLYATARAEIDRKDLRIAAQERELASLKCLLAQSRNSS